MIEQSGKKIDLIVTDFDGVFTDNKVYVDQNGIESVCCNRSDGLAIEALKRKNIEIYILSREKNRVIQQRAKKLNIPVFGGIDNKSNTIEKLMKEKNFEYSRTMYVGNDLNDYEAMSKCKFRCCPADSHSKIKEIAFVLNARGGEGVIREIVESILNINMLEILKDI